MTVLWILLGVLAAIILLLCLPLTLRLSWLPKPEQPAPCLLTDEEKVKACEAAKAAGAHFVKTSTGFSTGGATTHDIALMRKTVGPEMGVKASGGIRDYATAMAMIEAGANRIGASAGIAIVAAAE